jgi:hypothetical protein
MKRILVFLFSILLTFVSEAQALLPGSIAFLSYQTNAPDGFAFVTLQDLPQETSISFTDNGWNGSTLFTNEQTLIWTSPDFTLPVGTVITVRDNNGVQELIGPGAISGGLPSLSASGDQVLAYTGTDVAPEFIAGITNSNWLAVCNTADLTNTTCLPSPLVNGVNAQSPVNSETVVTNMFFEIGELNGTPDQIRTALMNWNNWTISNDIGVAGYTAWPDWEFSPLAPEPLSLTVNPGDLTLTEGAAASSIVFSLNGPAFGNQRIGYLVNGMIDASDLQLSPTLISDTLWIEFPSGSNQAVLDIGAINDGNSEGTEAGSLLPVSFSSGLVSNSSPISISIDDLQGVSLIQFTSNSENIIEGDSLQITLSINPAASENSFVILNLNNGLMLEGEEYLCNSLSGLNSYELPIFSGDSEISFTIKIAQDDFPEATEILALEIDSVGTGLLVGSTNSNTVSIPQNDQNNIPTNIFLNEVMASNDTTIMDENGFYSDWVEVYNAGGSALNLEGLYISDDALDPYKYKFSDLNLLPGSFNLLWADDSTELGNSHLNFRLSASGEQLFLFAAADEPVMIDSMNVPALAADQSYGSPQNGNQNRQIFDVGLSTPAASNLLSSIEAHDDIEVLSVYPNPVQSGSVITLGLDNLDAKPTVYISDLSGRIVHTANALSFVLPELKSGYYIVRCLSPGIIIQTKSLVVN